MSRLTVGIVLAATLIASAADLNAPVAAGAVAEAGSVLAVSVPARARSRVLAVEDYVLTVANLDRSIGFYRGVIGLALQHTSGGAVASPAMQSLTNTPGSRFRSATLRLPGSNVELLLVEYSAIRHRALRPHAVDPGAATLMVAVRDLSVVLAAAARAHTPVATRGGAPLIGGPDGQRAVVLVDPDGFYVSLSEGLQRPAHMVYTVAEPGTLTRFYRDVLGLRFTAGRFAADQQLDELINSPGAQSASTHALIANSADDLEFVAFRHIARHTYSGRPQDPGTAGMTLRVADVRAALRAVRSAGATVVSAGGQLVPRGAMGTSVLIRDPAGVLIELTQRP